MLLPGVDGWVVDELDLEPPRAGEVLVRMAFAGLCQSDEHARLSPATPRPMVGGHEGSGVVEAVGPGVARLKPGDRVVASFVPACGRCAFCASGRGNLCGEGAKAGTGRMEDGTYRFRKDGEGVPAYTATGTFAERVVARASSWVRVPDDTPLDLAALLSCGVLTGWGAATYAANLRPGDTAIVLGAGGVGLNAVQGAAGLGAAHVLAVDPTPTKRAAALRFGAGEAFATIGEAAERARALNPRAGGAQAVIVCVGELDAAAVRGAFDATARGGTVVLASFSHDPEAITVQLPGNLLAGAEKRLQGTIFGSTTPSRDLPLLLRLHAAGRLKLSELISATYPLAAINRGYEDLRAGRSLRGLIAHAVPGRG